MTEDGLAGALDGVSVTPRLLVAAEFEGALAEDTADPGDARAEQPSSEALNVLMALPDTAVAVITRRSPDGVSELMFLSGSKGGVRYVLPEEVAALRADLAATGLLLVTTSADVAEAAGDVRDGDVVVAVGGDEEAPGPVGDAAGVPVYRVDDPEAVSEVLEEMARLRRRP